MSARFAYDEVPYDTEANAEAHPRAMATVGRLFGLSPAPPGAARVLEIGCGDGEHMIAAASYLPRARFVGFDLAAEAIARGRAAAEACGVANVELYHRDVVDVRAHGLRAESGSAFDYVVAHGVYSWVPEAIRRDTLAVMRAALAPGGLAFVSVNALPGWELRRALRAVMREASAEREGAREKVEAALAAVATLAEGEARPGFAGVLGRAAAEYVAHVERATPPDAPFSRYVFHDLLADCNDAFSVTELAARARAAGLRLVAETPLGAARGRGAATSELGAAMEASGAPFLQALFCRDDEEPSERASAEIVGELFLWADLAPVREGAAGAGAGAGATGAGAGATTYRTTTGALVQSRGDDWLARAAGAAPGFLAVRDLASDAPSREGVAHDLLAASCEGLVTLATEPAPIVGLGGAPTGSAGPRVSRHVRARAADAARRGAASAVLTSALHRSFRVPWAELVVVRELDGTTDVATLRERAGRAFAGAPRERVPYAVASAGSAPARAAAVAAHVDATLDRFARHAFFVGLEEQEEREEDEEARP